MDIFIIDTQKLNYVPQELLEQFGHKELKNKEQKLIHQFTYLMLDRLLKEVYKIENRTISLKDGKPVLFGSGKHFSVSHSGDYIVFGFSDYECGIDIEKIKQRDYRKIAKRMKLNASTLEGFYIEWTKYEARYKLGKTPQSSYSFEIPDYAVTAVSENEEETFETYYNL